MLVTAVRVSHLLPQRREEDQGGEQGGEHQEAGNGAHEPVVEVFHVDEESQVDQEPEDEGL